MQVQSHNQNRLRQRSCHLTRSGPKATHTTQRPDQQDSHVSIGLGRESSPKVSTSNTSHTLTGRGKIPPPRPAKLSRIHGPRRADILSPGRVAKSESRIGDQNGRRSKTPGTHHPRFRPQRRVGKILQNPLQTRQTSSRSPALSVRTRWFRILCCIGVSIHSPDQWNRTHRLFHRRRTRWIDHHPLSLSAGRQQVAGLATRRERGTEKTFLTLPILENSPGHS